MATHRPGSRHEARPACGDDDSTPVNAQCVRRGPGGGDDGRLGARGVDRGAGDTQQLGTLPGELGVGLVEHGGHRTPGGPPGQAFLLGAGGPLSRFRVPSSGMVWIASMFAVIRSCAPLARMGSACHVSVGGMLGCSSPRRSSPYTACCLSLSTPKHRGRLLGLLLGILLDLRGNQIDPCAAITHSEARSRAPCSTGHLLQKPSTGRSGPASARSVVCTWSSTLIPSSRKRRSGSGTCRHLFGSKSP